MERCPEVAAKLLPGRAVATLGVASSVEALSHLRPNFPRTWRALAAMTVQPMDILTEEALRTLGLSGSRALGLSDIAEAEFERELKTIRIHWDSRS